MAPDNAFQPGDRHQPAHLVASHVKAGAAGRDVRFIPTGGVSEANLADYLALPNVAAVGGSWMVDPALVAAGDFESIARLCAAAVDQAGEVR